ncbi:uncharacterized protein DSM5745_09738 [Aspergillus mulundensis]|uniref:Major facilitator superfamily (MFS) profile domain-containing protein n=1 Tax=Aspergillus mulundensis TaxID=1810919 RepID=A0A3D8QRC5_9EURO|nr:hypothetical protein DSM5745_09738 [Aspergillus mulundensis]RDW64327.1 hypothetical protein DSM5745_09738 [Aspergillus mulundensis]
MFRFNSTFNDQFLHLDYDQETDDSIEDIATSWFVWLVAFTASIAGGLFGYDTGIISAVLVYLYSGLDGRPTSENEKQLITSLCSGGAFVGAIIAGLTADKSSKVQYTWADVSKTLGRRIRSWQCLEGCAIIYSRNIAHKGPRAPHRSQHVKSSPDSLCTMAGSKKPRPLSARSTKAPQTPRFSPKSALSPLPVMNFETSTRTRPAGPRSSSCTQTRHISAP